MQISIKEISMSLNGNLGLSWGITQPTEKNLNQTCPKLFKLVQTCSNLSKLSKLVQACLKLFKLFQTYSNLPKLLRLVPKIGSNFFKLVEAYPNLFRLVQNIYIGLKFSILVQTCLQFFKLAEICCIVVQIC